MDQTTQPPTLQASTWWTSQESTWHNNPTDDSYKYGNQSNQQWKPWGKWKNYSNNPSTTNPTHWENDQQPSNRHPTSSHDSTSKPRTAFSTSKKAPHRLRKHKPEQAGDERQHTPVHIPASHMEINLRDATKAAWIRAVKYALRHKDRMKAASEVPYDQQPQPSKTMKR